MQFKSKMHDMQKYGRYIANMYTKNNVEALADIRLSVNLARFANSLLCTVPLTLYSLDYPNYIINVNSEHSGPSALPNHFYCTIRVIAVMPHVYYSLRLIGHTDIALRVHNIVLLILALLLQTNTDDYSGTSAPRVSENACT